MGLKLIDSPFSDAIIIIARVHGQNKGLENCLEATPGSRTSTEMAPKPCAYSGASRTAFRALFNTLLVDVASAGRAGL
jgi:hypothetical protein